ncbi:response regulator transcription factor [Pseudonocardia eucalypti]|uniref:Response regulator transcription factor n=1 Tax=Pseudonocardia eucalypti TaxID=648755 RepID=A0ABP9PRZ1_9PSEU|nr:DNA-binding response OmpR family regulator [Pseudonocardia eucalypti]
MRVLVVQDDDQADNTLSDALSAQGHRPVSCEPETEALMANLDTDLVLLDLSRPDVDCFQVLRQLWGTTDAPVLLLNANRGGAAAPAAPAAECPSDPPTEPIPLPQLLAAARGISREAGRRTGQAARPKVKVGDVQIDLDARTVRVGSRYITLTMKEFDILEVLARQVGVAVSRKTIMDEVWRDTRESTSHALNVHLTALRTKLDRPNLLCTIRGFGYRLG